MSAYLSPIQSSGDSTPVESLISSQSCIPLVKEEMDQIENEFPVREFKQTTNKRQASKTIDTGRQKKSTTTTTTNKKPRLAIDNNNNNSTLIATTSSDEEELENSSSGGDANEHELSGHESRFVSGQQSYLSRHKIGRGQQRCGQRIKECSSIETKNHHPNHKPHQCLADQFLSMISIAAKSEQNQINHQQRGNETRSSSCVSSESDLLNGNETNNFNHHDQEHKFKRLLTRVATRQQKLRKRFKQILQSIPVVQLVATTSIMTIIILLSLLLLGDSQHFVTALKSHRTSTAETTTGELDGKQHDESNHNHNHLHHHPQHQHDSVAGIDTIQTSGGNIDQRQLSALPQMQSLVMGTRIGQPEASQRNPLAQVADSALADENLKLDETSSQQRRPVVNLRRELIGNLFARRQHQRHHNSHHQHQQHHSQHSRQLIDLEHGRAPEKRQFEARLASDEQLNPASEPQQQEQQQQVGLFDSLGSMLFGAANQQQAQPVADELGQLATSQADIDNDRATLERELSGNGDQEEGLQTAGFVLDGAPHVSPVMAVSPRPAHLHSSALVLGGASQQQSKQHLSARQTGSHPRQQQQQHVAGGGANLLHHRQNEPQVDRQQQQPADSTMASNRHERKFDVPQIQCNNTDEGFERYACPTPDNLGRYRCIEDVLVCDGYFDCPNGEDEDRTSCMYYRLFISHIDILTNTFLTWMKSQTRQAANDITSNQNANNQHNHRQQPLHLVGGDLED